MRRWQNVVGVAVALVACANLGAAAGAEEPVMGHWWYYPVAHGTPTEPVPAAQELLKVVPRLREAPEFSEEQRELGVALWWADHSQILYCEQPPSGEDLARKPEVRTPAGEDEPLVLGIWSITRTGSVSLSVKESAFPVTIRRVVFALRYLPTPYRGVKIEGGRDVGFATFMPESGMDECSPGRNVVFWINVAVPEGTKAGRYEITLELIVHQAKVADLPVMVEVLPFDLPRADIAYGMYFRGVGPSNFLKPRYTKPELMKAYWKDLARHGMTSISWYVSYTGPDIVDKDGKLRPIDGHASVRHLLEMKEAELVHADIPIMMLSSNLASFPKAATAVREEFAKRGLPELLAYGWDEPPVNEKARAFFETMQPVRKYMRNTTAINDYAAAAYADLIDVWVVNGGRITPEIRTLAADKGAELWTYDCSIRGRGNSTRARFYAGLYTWAFKLKGNFHWCYAEGYTWEGERNAVHVFVLPSDGGPVPSVAWEARREGVEDYRLLRLLESRIAAKPGAPAAKEAQKWLDEIRSRVNWNLIKGMPKSVYPWDGAEVYPMCPDFEPKELSEIRARVIDCILALD